MEFSPFIVVSIALMVVLFSLFLGCPIFISLGIGSVVGTLMARGFVGLGTIPSSMYTQLSSFILVAIPLFILMGEIISHTGIGNDLYESLSRWLYRMPGGLAVSSIYACAFFGAMCGVSIAGVGTIGPLAVPEMLKRKYNPRLAAGSVTAAGALAMLIPPSISFIIYGAITFVSVGELFIAGIFPGLLLATLMAIYVIIRVMIIPSDAPRIYETISWEARLKPLLRLWPSLIIILAVLGSIYAGICTPTEAAALGVIASALVAKMVYKTLTLKRLGQILAVSARSSVSILVICACAFAFGNFLGVMRVPEAFAEAVLSLPLSPIGIVFVFMVALVILGMFVDGISLILVTTPILLPALLKMGFDPLWYGVILTLNIEMAVITPPVGLNLYAMKGVCPELNIIDIIWGTMPYVIIEFFCLALFILFPDLVFWLPNLLR
ncbi:MAG: TRAP transporter large permease [Pseudomonadota bacterium]